MKQKMNSFESESTEQLTQDQMHHLFGGLNWGTEPPTADPPPPDDDEG